LADERVKCGNKDKNTKVIYGNTNKGKGQKISASEHKFGSALLTIFSSTANNFRIEGKPNGNAVNKVAFTDKRD
jgi:hypothetical protein